MKTMKTCCALIGAASFLTAPSLFASIIGTGTATVVAPGLPADDGGPYTATTSATTGPGLGTFETFCVSEAVNFSSGASYQYSLDTVIYPQGLNPAGAPGDAYVDLGTAWLYSQYSLGLIGSGSANNADNDNLQDAIWWFQGVGGSENAYALAAEAAVGGAANAQTDADGAYGVYAMNLFTTDANGGVTYAQAQLAVVPEPSTVVAGALLLLPFGVSTLRILRKKQVS